MEHSLTTGKRLPAALNRLLPVKYGVVLGCVSGAAVSLWVIFEQNYLGHQLYNTAVQTAARMVDLYSAAVFAAACLAFLFVWLHGRLSGRRGGREPLTALMAALMVMLLTERGASGQAREGVVASLLSSSSMERILYAVIAVGLSLLLLIYLRSNPLAAGRASGFLVRMSRLTHRLVLRLFPTCAVLFLVLNAAWGAVLLHQKSELRRQPNVLFILVDTLRADRVGCYGHTRNTTPNIDLLAKESLRFERALAQAPFTRWSVPSILSSIYPQRLASGQLWTALPPSCSTIAEAMKDRGYATLGVVSNGVVMQIGGIRQGFDVLDYTENDLGISSPSVVDRTLELLPKSGKHKFFMFALFMDAHSPYILHDEYEFSRKYRGNGTPLINIPAMREKDLRFTAAETRRMRDYYDSEIRFTDSHIGRLIGDLKKRGLYDNTLIVLLSDHGEEFGEHGKFFHGFTLYDAGLHVPLLIKLPNKREGRVVRGQFPLIDLFPSVMGYLGRDISPMKPDGDRVDLPGLQEAREKSIYCATSEQERLRGLYYGRYKYIRNIDTSTEMLFDRQENPGETRNIAASQPQVTKSISGAMDGLMDRLFELKIRASDVPSLTDQDRERLRGLGYLAK